MPSKAALGGKADLPVLVPDSHDPLLNLREQGGEEVCYSTTASFCLLLH